MNRPGKFGLARTAVALFGWAAPVPAGGPTVPDRDSVPGTVTDRVPTGDDTALQGFKGGSSGGSARRPRGGGPGRRGARAGPTQRRSLPCAPH
jgi:hypothetical protein